MKIAKPVLYFIAFKAFTLASFAAFVAGLENFRGAGQFLYYLKNALNSWDSWIYLSIAQKGYDELFKCAFFPLFPLLCKNLSFIFRGDIEWAAIYLSLLFSFAAVIVLYNLVLETYGEKEAAYSTALFLAAPTALFYSSFYTESLFLMLTVIFFYLLHKKMWLAAALTAGLAAGTRNVGMFLAPALLLDYCLDKAGAVRLNAAKKVLDKAVLLLKQLDVKICLLCLVSLSGLIFYMIFLHKKFGDPFMFYNAAKLWPERNGFIFPFWDLLMHLKNFTVQFQLKVTADRMNMCFMYFLSALALLIWGVKRLKPAHALFYILVMLVLALQPRVVSMSRYVSAVFAVWVLLAMFIGTRKKEQVWYITTIVCFLIWQLYANFRWYMGYWVS